MGKCATNHATGLPAIHGSFGTALRLYPSFLFFYGKVPYCIQGRVVYNRR